MTISITGKMIRRAIGPKFCSRSFGIPPVVISPAIDTRFVEIWLNATKYIGMKDKTRHDPAMIFTSSTRLSSQVSHFGFPLPS